MPLCDQNCWTLSYRSAFLATILAHNPVSMIMILTFSPTTFILELFIAVASKRNKYDKIKLTNDFVLFFFRFRKWKMCRLRSLPLQFLLVGSRVQRS